MKRETGAVTRFFLALSAGLLLLSSLTWAAAAPFLLIQACLGLTLRGRDKRVVFERPCLPEGIPHLSIHGLRVGDASVDLMFERQGDTARVQVLEKQGEVDVVANL